MSMDLTGEVCEDDCVLYVGDVDLEEVSLDFGRFADPMVIRNVEFKVYIEDGQLCAPYGSPGRPIPGRPSRKLGSTTPADPYAFCNSD